MGTTVQSRTRSSTAGSSSTCAVSTARTYRRGFTCSGRGRSSKILVQGKGATVELKLPRQTWQEGVANHVAYTEAVAERLNQTYQGKPVRVVPGGTAFGDAQDEVDAGRVPGMKDFFAEMFADGIHLTPKGRYLISLVHYACIYKESPAGEVLVLAMKLTADQVAIFHRIAWDAVKNYPWTSTAARP